MPYATNDLLHTYRLYEYFIRRTGAPWARATKNVKKPPGEKGLTFRKPKNTFGPKVTFLILSVFFLFHLGIRIAKKLVGTIY